MVFEPVKTRTEVTLMADSTATAGDLFQDILLEVGTMDVASVVDFPEEAAAFREVLIAVSEAGGSRVRMVAEMADAINAVKNLVCSMLLSVLLYHLWMYVSSLLYISYTLRM